ncbi:hypothetical protein DAPPUDRAFT_258148 [Daphnia pulex]|uniref:Uncharacterized protein n=1 Tax=Daphnia pulex TaxID=6669 RepID=E9HEU5_DAPPU|nr:hypothetical protein DAPPUDRAFT_258148 [Daphnia pulex]|eukprot:EFX69730.1 hypothetical protein DAPPUDRAFT_258148 [Daphnia pulex]
MDTTVTQTNLTKDGNSQFFHERVSTATGTALVFITLGILPMLHNSEEIACDATFATMFPLAYAIMTEKTQALYSSVFDRVDRVIEVLRTTGDNYYHQNGI